MCKVTASEAAEILSAAPLIRVFSHRRPDGDTVGSVFALAFALRELFPEKTVLTYCPGDLPERLSFLAEGEGYLTEAPNENGGLNVTVDVASPNMLGTMEESMAQKIDLQIDHHGTGTAFGKKTLIDLEASAASEIAFDVINFLRGEKPLGTRVWNALYGGISSDTGCFCYSNVTPHTHRVAAELLSLGAEGAKINHRLFECRTQGEIRAIAAAYENMRFFADGKGVILTVTNEMKERYSLSDEDLGEISALTREIAGIQLGITLRQSSHNPRSYKVSMRSGEEVNCAEICALFGGGGHIRASGGEVEGDTPEEAEGKIFDALKTLSVFGM